MQQVLDLASERALLGLLLSTDSKKTINKILTELTEDEFNAPEHRIIFGAAKEHQKDGGGISPVLLAQFLIKKGLLEQAGDRTYLHQLVGEAALDFQADELIDNLHELRTTFLKVTAIDRLRSAYEQGATESIFRAENDFRKALERTCAAVDDESAYEANELAGQALGPEQREDVLISHGILNRKSACIISAYAKTYKTMLGLNAACALASGTPFLGFSIPKLCKVIYVQQEVSLFTMQGRIRRMIRGLRAAGHDLPHDGLYIVQGRGMKITNYDDLKRLRIMFKARKPDVVFFDPLYKLHTGEENSAKEMKEVLDRFDNLVEEFGISVVIVHHHGKPSEQRSGGSKLRGSSVIFDYVDTSIRMERTKEPLTVRVSFTLRDDEDPEDMTLRLNPNTLWLERSGTADVGKYGNGYDNPFL